MNNFDKAFNIAMSLEFSSMYNALHKNKGENGWTFMGIYEAAHPNWNGWNVVRQICKDYSNIQKASKECYESDILYEMVQNFYKKEFWDALNLDKINDENARIHLFCLAINAGRKNAVRVFQKALNIAKSGKMDDETIHSINEAKNLLWQDTFYTDEIANFYKEICKINPNKNIFLKGWLNRIKKIQAAIN